MDMEVDTEVATDMELDNGHKGGDGSRYGEMDCELLIKKMIGSSQDHLLLHA